MAILAHFSACILIDGKPCKEYPDQKSEEQGEKTVESDRKVIKYIEVLTGAHFAVRVQREKTVRFKRANGIVVEYFSDGKKIEELVLLKDQFNADGIPDIEGKSIGNGSSIRPFKFGDIKFRDTETTDRAALLAGKHAELATLTIKVWLAKCTKCTEVEFSDLEEDTDAIPEAAIKGGAASVRASFGEAQLDQIEWELLFFETTNFGKMPIAEFSFKCRTREDLQQLSVIPRPRSPTPLEDRSIESLTFEETKELLRRKKIAEEASRVKVKQEKKAANLRELAAIKRSRDEAEDDDETIEVTTVLKKKRTEPTNVIELD